MEGKKLATRVIIENNEGDILLLKRAEQPFIGCYDLPGGKVEKGESIEHCAIREVFEETKLSVELGDFHMEIPINGYIVHYFSADVAYGNHKVVPHPVEFSQDQESHYFSPEEINSMFLAFPEIGPTIRRYLDFKSNGVLP